MTRPPTLGPRGEGWLAGQVVLMTAIGVAGVSRIVDAGSAMPWAPLASIVGIGLIGTGVAVSLAAYGALRSTFSPFPRPIDGGHVVASGIYRRVRHPMYVGVVLGGMGWSIATGSAAGLAITAGLAVLFDIKARLEEAWLTARYPDYAAYRSRTRRFIPGVY